MRMLGPSCSADAFWQALALLWEHEQLASGRRRQHATRLRPSVIMTTLIFFALLRQRALIESVNDHLENIRQIERSHYRSSYTFPAHFLAGLIAHCHQPKSLSLHLHRGLDLLAAE